jgi:hypothetical protein
VFLLEEADYRLHLWSRLRSRLQGTQSAHNPYSIRSSREKRRWRRDIKQGWLKKEKRAQGETWVLFFRTTRKSGGKRVENVGVFAPVSSCGLRADREGKTRFR